MSSLPGKKEVFSTECEEGGNTQRWDIPMERATASASSAERATSPLGTPMPYYIDYQRSDLGVGPT